MRLLNVAASLDPHDGGTSERTLQMSRALHKTGVKVRILTTAKHFHEVNLGSLQPSQVTTLPFVNERFCIPLTTYPRIRSIVAEAVVIHLISHWTPINAIVAKAAWSLGVPYVICPAEALRITGASRNLKRLYDAAVGRQLVRRASRVIAVTRMEIDDFVQYGVPRSKIVVVPNAVDLAEYADCDDISFRTRYGLSGRPLVLFLGRLHPIKGPDLLLDAFLPLISLGYDLVLAGGDGGLQKELPALWRGNHAEDRVRFIGHITGRDKSLALRAASLLVIPSRREAMSIVVLEAAAAATPVLPHGPVRIR